jgi:hypothetical protein
MGVMGTVGAFRKVVTVSFAILENLTARVHALHLKIPLRTRVKGEIMVSKGHATPPAEEFVLGTLDSFVGLEASCGRDDSLHVRRRASNAHWDVPIQT